MSLVIRAQMHECLTTANYKSFGELKKSIMPSSVFKYFSVNDNSISSLENNYLWLSSPSMFNDPYDSQVGVVQELWLSGRLEDLNDYTLSIAESQFNFTSEELIVLKNSERLFEKFQDMMLSKYPEEKDMLLKMRSDFENQLRDEIANEHANFNQNINNNVKVCCLSEISDSILMWSHYADSHRGICCEYNLNDPAFGHSDLIEFYPVHYSDEFLDLGKYQRQRREIYDICIMSAILKHLDWAYEREWRFFRLDRFGNKFKVPSPTSIYFGTKCDFRDEKVNKILTLARVRGIKTYRMALSTESFRLVPIHFE